jgi:hypothetical protein
MNPPESQETGAPLTLKDLLGALASDVTAARAHADAEAMRIARIYRGDPLLRTLPAPLFRLADLTISLPVAILAVPDPGGDPPVPLPLAASTVLALVLEALAARGGETAGPVAGELARAIEVQRGHLERESDAALQPVAIADALLNAALGALTEVQRALLEVDALGGGAERELRLTARARILALAATPGVHVAATTAALEALNSPDLLVQLRVNLSERGVQWAIGEDTDRLVPE